MTPEQVRHRSELLAALDGPAPDDYVWAEFTAQMWGPENLERVARPRTVRLRTAEQDQRSTVCPACLTGHHGGACDGPRCRCRCRATLGLAGPFEHGDPTAPGLFDQADQTEHVA